MSEKQMKILGWVATFMSVMMYVSYFPQIMNNLAGQKGNFIQPLVAAINCSLWVYYGLFKKERDIPLAAANAPGIIFGLVTVITALFSVFFFCFRGGYLLFREDNFLKNNLINLNSRIVSVCHSIL